MDKNEAVIGKPFVGHVDQEARPEILNPTEFLKKAFERNYSNNDNLIRFGQYKLMGYKYDFRHMLTQFLIKQYGEWREVWAPDEDSLRIMIYGVIDKIIILK